jgi:hypothetical protein
MGFAGDGRTARYQTDYLNLPYFPNFFQHNIVVIMATPAALDCISFFCSYIEFSALAFFL